MYFHNFPLQIGEYIHECSTSREKPIIKHIECLKEAQTLTQHNTGHGYMTILEKLGHITTLIQQFIYTIIY